MGMDSVRKANQRLRNYPILISKCADKASSYAICVTRDLNVKKDICSKEFAEFKICIQNAAKEMKTKL